MAKGVTARVRHIVIERDQHRCALCGQQISEWPGYSLQHRRARGMGGSRREDTNLPANLIVCCGSATNPACHQFLESHPGEAMRLGFRLSQMESPANVAVKHALFGWVYLDNDGGYVPVEEPLDPEGSAA